jgi:long-chain acyl-CoA synthetase
VLPLFHIYGLGPGLGMVARTGATGVLVERFDASQTLAVMAAEGVTSVIGAPSMYAAWAAQAESDALAAGFNRVRLAISGAAPLPELTYKRLVAAGLWVHEGYGLTETAPVLASTLADGPSRPGSVGWPIPGVQIELRDADGEVVEDDDPGEIWVRGANLFSGYWPDGAGGPDPDGWWATGDVAYADDDGGLHLVDRRKDLVLVSGFNVYPAEVEAVLDRHPDVMESAVIGVPDDTTGEAVKAYVVPRPGAALQAEDVLGFAAASLARFKLPVHVVFVDRLPRSANGKVRKVALRTEGRG